MTVYTAGGGITLETCGREKLIQGLLAAAAPAVTGTTHEKKLRIWHGDRCDRLGLSVDGNVVQGLENPERWKLAINR